MEYFQPIQPLINPQFWDYTVKCNSGTKKEN